jgi:hypothetical protein
MLAVNKVVIKKRGRGRPRKDDPIKSVLSVALSGANAERFARWMAERGIDSRSEAGRIMIEEVLDRAEKRAAAPKRKGATK